MRRVQCSLIAAVALIVATAAPSYAAADGTEARAKPSSFAPRGHPGQRAYGAPIQRPIMKRRSRAPRRPQPPALR